MRCNYLKNKKLFVYCFLHFPKMDQIFNMLGKKISLIAYLFPKLQTAKDAITHSSKNSCFRSAFEKQHDKQSQTLLKSAWHQLHHVYWWLWRKLSWKNSVLVICKILGLFVNTLAADDKYFLLNKDILTQPIGMQFSITKTFCTVFFSFLHFWYLDQLLNILMILIAYLFPMLRTVKDVITQMSKMSFFRRPFNKKHGKRSQKLLKFAR